MKLKVLHICVGFENRLYDQLFSRLSNNEIDQFVFFPRRLGTNKVDFSNYKYNGYAPLIHKKWFRFAYPVKIKRYINSIEQKFKVSKQEFKQYKIIHAHTLFADGAVAYNLSKKHKLKYIVALRYADEEYLQKMPFLKNYGKRLIENAEQIICISPHLKNKFIKIYAKQIPKLEEKIKIIPNGIDEVFLESKSKPKQFNNTDKINLFYIGSFLKWKNVPALINYVNKFNHNLTIIGGGGDNHEKVVSLIEKSKKVKYLGKIKDKQKLIECYRKNDIFVMISKTETFGLVYIEALSQATPIIYSKNTGFDGFLPDGTVGYGVNPNKPDEISDKIELIKAHYSSLSESAIKFSKHFNWDKIAQEYINIYKNLLSKY